MKTTLLFAIVLGLACGSLASAEELKKKRVHFSSEKLHRISAKAHSLRAADEEGAGGPIVTREPVEFTIETKDCSLIKSRLTASGMKKETINVSMNEDGSFHFDIREEASGTAVDEAGNKYIFLYVSLIDLDSNTPEPVPPFEVVGPDTFRLIPMTSAGTGYEMAQYFKGTVTDSLLPVAANAPLGCDPL